MRSKVKRLVGVSMVVLLSVTGVDAAGDLPLVDAARDRDIVGRACPAAAGRRRECAAG